MIAHTAEKENLIDMEEKKLTDEEIVKDIERSTGMPSYWKKIVLDLIHRLQDDYSKLKERYVKVLDLNEKVIAKQKAEIERLTKESNEMFDRHAKENQAASILIEKRNNEIAELQKQVDELKAENTELYKEHTTLIAGSILEKQNIVKDTAKEIYGEIDDSDILVVETQEYGEIEVVPMERLKEIIKRYGVEVE